MTDIETKEAMRASWVEGYETAKMKVSFAFAAYDAAIGAFEAEEVLYSAHIDQTGQAIGYHGFNSWGFARNAMTRARLQMMEARNELDSYVQRMEQA